MAINRQDQPTVYLDPDIDKWVYRASGLGNCIGHLVRCRLGLTPEPAPDFMQTAFNDGKYLEPQILEWLQQPTSIPGGGGGVNLLDEYDLADMGYDELHDGQVEVQIPVGNTAVVRCHPDGIGTVYAVPLGSELELRERVVVEAKALGEAYYKQLTTKPITTFPSYAWQLSVEMLGTGLPCVYVKALKAGKDGRDEDGNMTILGYAPIHVYREPPFTLGNIKARVLKVEALAEREEIPECDYAMFPCGFWRDHDTESGVHVKKDTADKVAVDVAVEQAGEFTLSVDDDTEKHMADLAERLVKVANLNRQKAEIEAEIKKEAVPVANLSDLLARILKAQGKTTSGVAVVAGHRFEVKTGTTKGRVSWKDAALSVMQEPEAEKFRGEDKPTVKVTLLEGE